MIVLAVPYVAPTMTLILKNPELADDYMVDNQTKFDFAMSGDVYSFIKTAPNEKIKYTFTELTRKQVLALEDFLVFAMGKDIKLTDYNAIDLKVRLIGPVFDDTTDSVGRGTTTRMESNSITLEFEKIP